MRLEGKVALVTGAARRIGRAIALRLARAGCHVAVHYWQSGEDADAVVRECRAAGVEAEAFQADLSDAQASRDLIGAVTARFDRLDVLVSSAAVFEPMGIDQFDLERWERTLRVNLTAPMVLAHAARDELRRNCGRVIHICDAATARAWPDHLAYVVSKGALETLTRALARSLAPEVNVVAIAPGVAAWPESYDEPTRRRLTAKIPLQRAGSPEEIAAAVHFVLSEGDYITGAVIPIDGGRSLG